MTYSSLCIRRWSEEKTVKMNIFQFHSGRSHFKREPIFALHNKCSSMIQRYLLGCGAVKSVLWAVKYGFIWPSLQRAPLCTRKCVQNFHAGGKKLAAKFVVIRNSGLTSSKCGGYCAKMVRDLPRLVLPVAGTKGMACTAFSELEGKPNPSPHNSIAQ